MYKLHERLHEGLIEEIGLSHRGSLLEIACGTGWNVNAFVRAGFDYYGWDISETALARAMNKYPSVRFFNLGVNEGFMFRDQAFDVVYNSSMLEHIGFWDRALLEMIRLARHVYVVFFEGLTDGEDNEITFFPYTEKELLNKDLFGRKIVLQDHQLTDKKGYYWNRYSRRRVEEILRGHTYEFLQRPYIANETVLHIMS